MKPLVEMLGCATPTYVSYDTTLTLRQRRQRTPDCCATRGGDPRLALRRYVSYDTTVALRQR